VGPPSACREADQSSRGPLQGATAHCQFHKCLRSLTPSAIAFTLPDAGPGPHSRRMRFAIAAFLVVCSTSPLVFADAPLGTQRAAPTAWALTTWHCDAMMAVQRTDTDLRFSLTVRKPGGSFKWSIRSEDGTSRGEGKIVALKGTHEEIQLDDPYGSPLPPQVLQCVTVTTDETKQPGFGKFSLCKAGAVVIWTPVHDSPQAEEYVAVVAKCF
jgi:hypothetical protein